MELRITDILVDRGFIIEFREVITIKNGIDFDPTKAYGIGYLSVHDRIEAKIRVSGFQYLVGDLDLFLFAIVFIGFLKIDIVNPRCCA